ncbi:bifunctional DNA-formamidopyrimidine glycosylase/DNA-(apurinic or apyrimidinic site) lyase [Desulfosediminicola flagellatus]|uniref:bifunctional DNA-formamidopyrimidine glycosylase/DNA-(apurinic or apyrimidinic site) lyase n=1 Tax=Desulfosediminicola flagellatus TaxID=2569541 RepID=UPI0010AD2F9B|nr:bifunctional DNA-formamidopyrimidine glycosylase/DNA-(apurinic or apyrimidinic site) lyase [Desulfosediminicola flagellatus]
MPELPEVETICRGIRPHILNRTILKIHHSGKRLRKDVPLEKLRTLLIGHRIVDVQRRAKFLLIHIENGTLMVIHLGMTGNLGLFTPETTPHKHCHLQFLLNDGMELRYTDVRRFGFIEILDRRKATNIENTLLKTTGPEPFSDIFNAAYLFKAAKGKSQPVKSFIMTNQIVAGVGNIYANESLFVAGINPKTPVGKISKGSWETLISNIRKVLSHAIECGGSTISDYVNASQETGYFQINFKVYGKDGDTCALCKSIIQKTVIGGRATFFCDKCQK